MSTSAAVPSLCSSRSLTCSLSLSHFFPWVYCFALADAHDVTEAKEDGWKRDENSDSDPAGGM